MRRDRRRRRAPERAAAQLATHRAWRAADQACRTAPDYRLYALEGTVPPKPGLVRDDTFHGPGIEVEVWAMPEDRFGSFVADVPPPLGIGSVLLDDGETVKCFICEPYAIAGAAEITRFGGWRGYLSHSLIIRDRSGPIKKSSA